MFGYNGEKVEKLNILLFGWGKKKRKDSKFSLYKFIIMILIKIMHCIFTIKNVYEWVKRVWKVTKKQNKT